MTVLGRQFFIKAAKLYDLVALSACFLVASLVVARQTAKVSLEAFLTERIMVRDFVIFVTLLLVWHILFTLFGLYDSRQLSQRRGEIVDVLAATALGTGSTCVAVFLFRLEIDKSLFVLALWVMSSVTLVSTRLAAGYLLSRIGNRRQTLREIVIVGTNSRALLFAQKIQAKPVLGYRVAGFVDQEWEGLKEFRNEGYSLASDFEKLPSLLRERVVDEVILSLPMKSMYPQASRIAALCEEHGIVVRVLSNIFNLRQAQLRAEEFEGEVVTTYRGWQEDWRYFFKRALDVVGSLLLMVILAPLSALVAVAIKLTSRGPVIFTQERVGLNNRRFQLYKFRTMVVDAEERQRDIEHLNELSGPVFKIRNDPRLTSVGKFLRKASIDELPQFYNVLRGDMSLVGPRPLSVRDYNKFDREWRRRRFSVRPGITCLWQVNGRSSIPFEKWMDLDMEYIDHWSLKLDFKILGKTIPAVLRGIGAA